MHVRSSIIPGFFIGIATLFIDTFCVAQQVQIPLGTNVQTGVVMSSLTLQTPPVQFTNGEDQEVPLTVFFSRTVETGTSDVAASARFDLRITVKLRASQIAAVAGLPMSSYDDMSNRMKMQATSALGLQAGLPRLRALLTAMYTGADSDTVTVSALALDDASADEVTVTSSDDSRNTSSAVFIEVPEVMRRRASEVMRRKN